jgi:hypothetical protein
LILNHDLKEFTQDFHEGSMKLSPTSAKAGRGSRMIGKEATYAEDDSQDRKENAPEDSC